MALLRYVTFVLLLVICFSLQLKATEKSIDPNATQVLMIVHNPDHALNQAMAKVMRTSGAEVIIYPGKDMDKPGLSVMIENAQLMIFGKDMHERSSKYIGSEQGKGTVKRFISSGGSIFFFWPYIWAGDWKDFFKENGIWFSPLDRIKPYLPHQIAFTQNWYVPNKKIKHLLLEKPNVLENQLGTQSFGLPVPQREDMIRLIVSKENTADVGVSLQEKVLGRGNVFFSALYQFMIIKAASGFVKNPEDPMAEHSVQFLQNLVYYVRWTYDIALVDRVNEAIKHAQGTAAQEAANYLQGRYAELLDILLDGKVSVEKRNRARKKIVYLLDQLEKGPVWPKMEKREIPFASSAPTIDGKLDEEVWKHALTFDEVYAFNNKEKLKEPNTIWSILWDKQYLYFGFKCKDKDILGPEKERDSYVYSNDCMEMFILPDFRLGMYWELLVSPRSTVFDMLHMKNFKKGLHPGMSGRVEEDIKGLRCACFVEGTIDNSTDIDKGYSIEVAVPFTALPSYTRGNVPQPMDLLYLMLARIDKSKDKEAGAYSVKPLLYWGHNIWNYIPLVLAK